MTCTKDEKQGRGVCRPEKCSNPDCARRPDYAPKKPEFSGGNWCNGVYEVEPSWSLGAPVIQMPQMPEFDPEAVALLHRVCYWLNVAAIGLMSLVVIGVVAGYLYGRFSTVFWAWANLNF